MEESILDFIGSELIAVITPVSICMFLVVLLLSSFSSPTSSQLVSFINLVFAENPTDSTAVKLTGAVENAVVFILLIAAVTFLIVILYYYNCTNFLKNYMRFSIFFMLLTLGGAIILSIVRHFSIDVDVASFAVFMLNFSAVGVVAVFGGGGVPIVVTQGYTVALGIIMAAWFTQLPEWTTWALLVALSVYDLVAVLMPGGPLKILLELQQSRDDDDLPALVYEARPRVMVSRGGGIEMQSLGGNDGNVGDREEERVGLVSNLVSSSEIGVADEERPRVRVRVSGLRGEGEIGGLGDHVGIEMESLGGNGGNVGDREEERVGLVSNLVSSSEIGVAEEERPRVRVSGLRGEGDHVGIEMESLGGNVSDREEEKVGLVSNLGSWSEIGVADEERSGLVEGHGGVVEEDDDSEIIIQRSGLGLGDFVFYSVLVGRAGMYDLMTVYACYLAIISGLACTITFSNMWRRSLPALPISIALGVAFYFLTRLLMEPFVVQSSTNLLMF